MNRPKISSKDAQTIAKYFYPDGVPAVLLIGVRGYFLNSIGKRNENDFNRWDDAILVLEKGELVKTFNANTDPSKLRADVAMLKAGIYKFYKGRHKNRIDALRAFPEGVKWDCVRQDRNGKWYEAKCSHINIHDGGLSDTWSAGCQTLPNYAGNRQFNEFRDLVYKLMSASKMKTVDYLLLTEDEMSRILNEKAAVDLSAPASASTTDAASGNQPPVDAESQTPVDNSKLKTLLDKYGKHCQTDSVKNAALVVSGRVGTNVSAFVSPLWYFGITGKILLALLVLAVLIPVIYAAYFYRSRIWGWITTVFDSLTS